MNKKGELLINGLLSIAVLGVLSIVIINLLSPVSSNLSKNKLIQEITSVNIEVIEELRQAINSTGKLTIGEEKNNIQKGFKEYSQTIKISGSDEKSIYIVNVKSIQILPKGGIGGSMEVILKGYE